MLADGRYYEAPFQPVELRGRSGRGDTCVGSYASRRIGADPAEATRWAAALTSLKLEAEGVIRRSREDVERLLQGKVLMRRGAALAAALVIAVVRRPATGAAADRGVPRFRRQRLSLRLPRPGRRRGRDRRSRPSSRRNGSTGWTTSGRPPSSSRRRRIAARIRAPTSRRAARPRSRPRCAATARAAPPASSRSCSATTFIPTGRPRAPTGVTTPRVSARCF